MECQKTLYTYLSTVYQIYTPTCPVQLDKLKAVYNKINIKQFQTQHNSTLKRPIKAEVSKNVTHKSLTEKKCLQAFFKGMKK